MSDGVPERSMKKSQLFCFFSLLGVCHRAEQFRTDYLDLLIFCFTRPTCVGPLSDSRGFK